MALCLVAFARLAFAEGDPELAGAAAGPAAGRSPSRKPLPTSYYQLGVSAGQRAFQRPDMGRVPHPHEFELYYDC